MLRVRRSQRVMGPGLRRGDGFDAVVNAKFTLFHAIHSMLSFPYPGPAPDKNNDNELRD
jgi:hypothetical protein